MNLNDIAKELNCQPGSPVLIKNVCIDSRQVQSGDLFVALRGQNFDGHDFIAEAIDNGAVAILCERASDHDILQLLVTNTLQALATIAMQHRKTINCPIIAVTGSNGKTSVKEMIASILPKPALATKGNLNNHIGAPLSVLQLRAVHRYAVFELGANHAREIAHTVAIVQPNVTLINNIAPAHIEGFGSIDGVARAKGEIHEGLGVDGAAVINEDDDYAHFWDNLLIGKRIIRFSYDKPLDVFASAVTFDNNACASFNLNLPTGIAPVTLRVPGEHSVRNALAAAACCYAVNIALSDIAFGLNQFQGVAGRMTYLSGKNQSLVIDDTYNANLRSVLTAVDVLAKRQGRRILVLGDLGELGDFTKPHHEEIGRKAALSGIDLMLTCGTHSEFTSKAFGIKAKHYGSQDELTLDLLKNLDKNTTVLVKGSRSAGMEKIVHQLVG